MTYQPESVQIKLRILKLWSFVVPEIHVKWVLIFGKDLVTGNCLYLEKIGFPTFIRFQIDFVTHDMLQWASHHVKFVYRFTNMPFTSAFWLCTFWRAFSHYMKCYNEMKVLMTFNTSLYFKHLFSADITISSVIRWKIYQVSHRGL